MENSLIDDIYLPHLKHLSISSLLARLYRMLFLKLYEAVL